MRAQIRNFRGVKTADLDLGKLTLIAGDNGAGKSSTLGALAAAVTGRGLPDGFTKSGAVKLVRDGADDGFVMLEGPNGKTSVPYPSLEVIGSGRAPFATLIAAGLSSILDMDAKERAKALITLLKADPSRDDLAKALAEAGIVAPFTLLDQVWGKIESTGWDGAHEAAQKRGAKMKGAWEEVTGKKYGKIAAEGWSPAGWLPEYSEITAEDADESLSMARASLESAVAGAAVDTTERERRATSAGRVEDLAAKVALAETALEVARAESDKAAAHLASLPDGAGYLGIPCPHCQGRVVVSRTASGAQELHKAQPDLPDAEKKAQRLARAGAEGDASRLRGEVGTKQAELFKLRTDLTAAEADAKWLLANPVTEDGGADVPAARAAVADAETLLRLIQAKNRAADRHAEVVENQIVIDLLAPNGLRQKKLAEIIDAFNTAHMAPLCKTATWAPVCLTPELGITYGGRPYALLSASEQWRVRVIIQIATALLDGSELILIDAADILSLRRRNGLFALLGSLDIPVVVAMTFGVPDKVPNLAAAGLGRTYWIADGVAVPLSSVAVKKAA